MPSLRLTSALLLFVLHYVGDAGVKTGDYILPFPSVDEQSRPIAESVNEAVTGSSPIPQSVVADSSAVDLTMLEVAVADAATTTIDDSEMPEYFSDDEEMSGMADDLAFLDSLQETTSAMEVDSPNYDIHDATVGVHSLQVTNSPTTRRKGGGAA